MYGCAAESIEEFLILDDFVIPRQVLEGALEQLRVLEVHLRPVPLVGPPLLVHLQASHEVGCAQFQAHLCLMRSFKVLGIIQQSYYFLTLEKT